MESESEIFQAAVKLPAAERADYLDKACAADVALRLEVESLLAAHGQPGQFMHRPAVAGPPPSSVPARSAPACASGPTSCCSSSAKGGMGTVFLAEQTQPVRRMVALKIIKQGMDSAQVLARFEAERQALALMDHPNIAKVLEAGTIGADEPGAGMKNEGGKKQEQDGGKLRDSNQDITSDSSFSSDPSPAPSSRPYFVMELVKGVPITEFCDKNKLTTRQRLELFIPV